MQRGVSHVPPARCPTRGIAPPAPPLFGFDLDAAYGLAYNVVWRNPFSEPYLGFGKGIEGLEHERDRSEASIARWIVSHADERLSRILVNTISQEE